MKRMVSGIKPSGQLTLGNYIGEIKQFVDYQDEYEMFVFIANLHCITNYIDKQELKKNLYDCAALYLACGLDTKKTTLFLQSDVKEHAQLGFILSCNTYLGELNRMTQYKDKLAKNDNQTSLSAGFYTYPTLMAADIMIYDADYVPVGIDQKQHVELARDIALRFNNKYGETFRVPTPVSPKIGAKIMSLSDPTKKMSKSEESNKGCIYLLDDIKIIRKKIMSAKTDDLAKVSYDVENQPGISNLLVIMSALSNTSIPEIVSEFANSGYGEFKKAVADVVCNSIQDIQNKYHEINEAQIVNSVLKEGKEKASFYTNKKLAKVQKRIGLDW
ncbi:MAG: tryptophan--tRNA ligase [Erysipelotrichaceae bacterium]